MRCKGIRHSECVPKDGCVKKGEKKTPKPKETPKTQTQSKQSHQESNLNFISSHQIAVVVVKALVLKGNDVTSAREFVTNTTVLCWIGFEAIGFPTNSVPCNFV